MTAMVSLVGDLILVPTAAVSMIVHHVIYEIALLLHVIPEGECCPVCPSDLLYYITKKPTEGTVTLPTLGPVE